MDGSNAAIWEAHYEAMPREGGHSTRCAMELPDDLTGKRVLDLACRRGKGVFKTADRVGPQGAVLGVDPSAAHVADARAALAGQGVAGARVSFARGCFEDLRAVGVVDASFDVVVVNSALNLAWDLDAALREIARALVPGGALCHAGVFAESSLPPDATRAFAAQGNVFGAARTQDVFRRAVLEAGFASCELSKVEPLVPADADADAALAPMSFASAVVLARMAS